MFAIAFDMTISKLEQHYGNVAAAYLEIGKTLRAHGFYWIQGSTYVTDKHDLSLVFDAINALAALEWFRLSVRDLRGFKIEDWSNFTKSVQRQGLS